MKTTEDPPNNSERDSASHPCLVRQFGAVWVAIRNGITAIGATRKDAIKGVEIEYTGHVPCPKCGMTHWMHGPCPSLPKD